jgi:putative redox protein
MSEVKVTWVEKQQFVGTDSGRHSIVMSAHNEENTTGSKPSDLLLLALGGCASVDLVDILRKQRQKVHGVQVVVSGEQQAEAPWTFTKIHVEVTLRGKGLSAAAVERAIGLSIDSYCSVAATIRATAPITTSYKLIEE